MKSGLSLLGDLAEEDIQWILANGQEKQAIIGTVILQENVRPDHLVFVMEGLVGVRISSLSDQCLATLGPGELLGEMSFLEDQPASATVFAVENTLLLNLPLEKLRAQIATNDAFAARLYHAFAVTGSRRLRQRERHYSSLLAAELETESQRSSAWERIQPMIEEFKLQLTDADKSALKDGQMPDEIALGIRSGFKAFAHNLNELIGDRCGMHVSVREELGACVQREMLPYLLLTCNAERLYAKPRGYAGDFKSIDWMYEDQAAGTGRLGPVLDRAFLDEPAAAAVRNRRGLLVREIRRHLQMTGDRPVRITVMACGPAREVFDVFAELDDHQRLEVTLIDIDQQALDQVNSDVERLGLGDQVRTHHGNLIYLAMGRQKIDLPPQDLMYSIGLIDYFNDKLVIKLADYAHHSLRVGGEMILGNFHPKNPDKALMDYVLDWRLIHRDEDDMNRLYKTSSFARECSQIHFEEAGVNMFAVCPRN